MPIIERLSDKGVRGLELPTKGNRIHYDRHPDAPRGFGVRVTAKGARSFILRYVARHREYRYTIGSFPDVGTERARKEARRLRAQIDLSDGKEHPMADRQGALAAHKQRALAETYRDAVQEYIRREQIGRKGNTTAKDVERRLLVDGEKWLDTPLKEIGEQEIFTHLELIRDGDPTAKPVIRPRPYLANRVHSYLRTFLKWCASPGVKKIDRSPMEGMAQPWCGEAPRTRFFDDGELMKLWHAADEIGAVPGAFVKIAMLTGKRRGALVGMQWEDIDQNGVWKPVQNSSNTKRNKRLHAVPLSGLAVEVLDQIRPDRECSGSVFPGRNEGTRLHPGSTLQRKVRALSGIEDFFMHAFRHTVETRMAELGVQPHIRDLVLDHAPARGSGAGYDHHHYNDEMREALNRWADHIENLLNKRDLGDSQQ
ncbi:site-specific integrase [uncultured Roseobacter sp.]|uniref:tyrosine-type recombinase/integrase n=1 Tax=uncultured Roseobacter sp. TaxID=114847 RepID=UPI002624E2BD|nr:site-specific integrase [uncultured Roseobacter sp.]